MGCWCNFVPTKLKVIVNSRQLNSPEITIMSPRYLTSPTICIGTHLVSSELIWDSDVNSVCEHFLHNGNSLQRNNFFEKAAKKDGVCMWGETSDFDIFQVEILIFQLIQL